MFGDRLEGQRQQGVTGQNGRRFVKSLVAGGTATAEIVVVHGGQIVVDERISVDHLHRARRRQGGLDFPAARFGRQKHEHRPQPFARREQTVPHRLFQPLGAARPKIRKLVERRLDLRQQPI